MDPFFKALAFKMIARYFGVLFTGLDRFDVAPEARPVRQPKGAVAEATADFEQPFGLCGSR